MKKILMLLAFLSLGSVVLAGGLSLGIKGGINLSSVSGTDAEGSEPHSGMIAGWSLAVSLLPSFALQTEMLYSQKGFKLSGDAGGVPWVGTYRMNYLEVPVLAKHTFGILAKPHVVAGAYFACRTSTLWEETVGGTTLSGSMDDYIGRADTGYLLGAGITTPAKLSFEVRYSNSFSSIYREIPGDWKNSVVSILAGYSVF